MSACPFRTQLDAWRPRIKGLVWHRMRRRWCHVDEADLMQVGAIGLWVAIERYDPSKGEFEPFAIKTIYGHILDEVKHHDYLSPWMRRKASAGEFATTTFIPLDDVSEHELQSDAEPCDMLALEQCREYLLLLPVRWQQILAMRYDRSMDWAAIAIACECSASAVRQMCCRAQKKLHEWMVGRHRPLAKHRSAP